jgi:hypothetical protein
MIEVSEGMFEGYKGVALSVFSYTGRQVAGVAAYKKACAAELARLWL